VTWVSVSRSAIAVGIALACWLAADRAVSSAATTNDVVRDILSDIDSPAPAAHEPARVEVMVKYERDGREAVLNTGEVLSASDNYRVIFEPRRDSYVYNYQIDAAQRIDTLFPNPKYSSANNPVAAKIVYSVPPEGRWLHLDGVRGKETLVLFASDIPITDPLSALSGRDTVRAGEGAAVAGPEPIFSYRLTFEHR
jgi:hypothetical protein